MSQLKEGALTQDFVHDDYVETRETSRKYFNISNFQFYEKEYFNELSRNLSLHTYRRKSHDSLFMRIITIYQRSPVH